MNEDKKKYKTPVPKVETITINATSYITLHVSRYQHEGFIGIISPFVSKKCYSVDGCHRSSDTNLGG